MKLNTQMKYFINGIILMILALFSVTFAPSLIKGIVGFIIPNYIFYEVEFFLLVACAIFFLFSPKYYKEQICVFLYGVLYYILFAKFYTVF